MLSARYTEFNYMYMQQFICRSTSSILIQITFGSDFTQQFNKLEREYNILKEDLVVVVFKGLGLSLRYPGYQVSIHRYILLLADKLFAIICSTTTHSKQLNTEECHVPSESLVETASRRDFR